MSYKHRIQAPNTLLHIINRGNGKKVIFHDECDHLLFLELIQLYKKRYEINVYHYALMSNHIHLMVEATLAMTISKFAQELFRRYSYRYNQKYHMVGHVWQARYRSIVIETESYYLRCGQSIELNPVRAGIALHPSEYPWSSYRGLIRKTASQWLDRHPRLERYQAIQSSGVTMYQEIIEQELIKIENHTHERFSEGAAYGGNSFLKMCGALVAEGGISLEADTELMSTR